MSFKDALIRDGRKRRSAAGMSLIEVMIALAIGTVLILGMVEVFSALRASFGAAEANSRIQENSRFALEFLRRDLRMAGHFGCLNEFGHIPNTTTRPTDGSSGNFVNFFVAPGANRDTVPYLLRLDKPVEVYDYDDTEPDDSLVIASDSPTPATDATKWTPDLPTELGLLNDVMPGSDVVVVRFMDESMISIAGGMVNAATGDMTLSATDAASVVVNAPYGITNCRTAGLFQVTGKSGTTISVNAAPNIQRQPGQWWPATFPVGVGTLMGRYQVVVYYIGQGVNGPALKRKTLPASGAAVAAGSNIALAAGEEVVEGVETMQVVLGIDQSTPRNDSVDAYVSPYAQVNASLTIGQPEYESALRQVDSLSVSLLLRGNESNRGAIETNAQKVVGDVKVTPPVDGRSRQVYDTLIAIRNRLRS